MCEIFGNIWLFYPMKSILDISKSLVDAELIYNLSILANCDNIYLFISDWSNTAIIHILNPHLILFLLIIGYIFFGVYFLIYVSPINTLPSKFLAQKKYLELIGNIISLYG